VISTINTFARVPDSKFAETFKHVTAEQCFFSEARDNNQHKYHSWDRGGITCEVMISLIDWWGAEKRHDDRFH